MTGNSLKNLEVLDSSRAAAACWNSFRNVERSCSRKSCRACGGGDGRSDVGLRALKEVDGQIQRRDGMVIATGDGISTYYHGFGKLAVHDIRVYRHGPLHVSGGGLPFFPFDGAVKAEDSRLFEGTRRVNIRSSWSKAFRGELTLSSWTAWTMSIDSFTRD